MSIGSEKGGEVGSDEGSGGKGVTAGSRGDKGEVRESCSCDACGRPPGAFRLGPGGASGEIGAGASS